MRTKNVGIRICLQMAPNPHPTVETVEEEINGNKSQTEICLFLLLGAISRAGFRSSLSFGSLIDSTKTHSCF